MVNTRRRVPQPGGSPIYSRPRVDPESRTNARRHAQLFVSGLIFISLVGTVFLALPWVTSSGQPTPLVDAFFTSVSAATVTGLSVVDTLEHWNWSGQFVILVLTQTGGLGFMVGASILLQMLRRGAGAYTLRDELLLRDGAPALSIQEAVFLAGRIVRFTFVVEIIGAAAARHLVWHGRRLATAQCALERSVLRGCGILQCRLRSHGGLSIDSDQQQPTSGSTSC